MSKTRRKVLGLFSLAGALPVLSGIGGSVIAAEASPVPFKSIGFEGDDYFEERGYVQIPGMPLITGHEFNGGVRYDDTPGSYPGGHSVRVQACARLEDLARRGEPGVLPFFHIVSLSIQNPDFQGELLSRQLEYFTQQLGLNPQQLVIVSTEVFQPYLPLLENHGMASSQFIQRDAAEARAAGDGSGYFNPAGHPHVQGQPTASIHYAPDEAALEKPRAYPLPGFLELGEICIYSDTAETPRPESGGFGLERISMALGKPVESFDDSQTNALAAIRAEADRRGVPLPAAYQLIESA